MNDAQELYERIRKDPRYLDYRHSIPNGKQFWVHEELCGPGGMSFMIFVEPHHTLSDIQELKTKILKDRDVVRFLVRRVNISA